MVRVIDQARFDAFVQLLEQPDPTDLPRRGHVPRYPGDPDRRQTLLPVILMGWLERRNLDVDVEEPLAPATRGRWPISRPAHRSLRGLQSTGTDTR